MGLCVCDDDDDIDGDNDDVHFGSFVFSDLLGNKVSNSLFSKHYMFRHPALITCFKRLQRFLGIFHFHPDMEKVKAFQNKLGERKGRTDNNSPQKLFLNCTPSGVCSFLPHSCLLRHWSFGHNDMSILWLRILQQSTVFQGSNDVLLQYLAFGSKIEF